MKQSLIFLPFAFLSLNGISQRPDFRNDPERMGLSKKVKCVREISYSKGSAANQKQETIIDSSFRNYLSCFLVDGKIDRLTSFSEATCIEFFLTYKYNEHGMLVEKRKMAADSTLISSTTIFYDQDNFKVDEISKCNRGEVIMLTKVTYLVKDLNRVKYKTATYFPESKATNESTKYEVYSGDNIISEILYDANNRNYRLTRYDYKVNKLSMKRMERSNGLQFLKTSYEYDQHGNLVITTLSPVQEIVTYDYTCNMRNDWIKRITSITNNGHKTKLSTKQIITEREIIYID